MLMYAYVWSEMNDSNDTKDERKELGLFCYYNILILPVKQFSVVWK